MRHTFLGRSKLIAGMALMGFGFFILCGNLADVAARFSNLVAISVDRIQTFGELTTVGLAVAQVWRSYLFDRRALALSFGRILLLFWPLLLVIVGTVLTGMASSAAPRKIQNKIPELSN